MRAKPTCRTWHRASAPRLAGGTQFGVVVGCFKFFVFVFFWVRLSGGSVLHVDSSRLDIFTGLVFGILLHTGVPAHPSQMGFDGEQDDEGKMPSYFMPIPIPSSLILTWACFSFPIT